MTRRPTLVFVGPTLAAVEVRERLPAATVRPPAAVGEVLRALDERPARIVLIDGYFERMAAVWHKELLLALERGIAVYGAASMGALRAAELHRFGMIGVGAIFESFRDGALVSDDEVAVAHLPAEQQFRPVSDALVNLRFGLAAATRARVITATSRAALVELARSRFYRERSWAQLDADARTAGVAPRELDALARWPKPDAKADDARRLLTLISRDPRPRRRKIRVPRTWALRQLLAM